MKTLMTAVLFAALAATGFAHGDEPVKTTAPAKPAVTKVTTEELGAMLEKMGYAPRPRKDKDGKVTGYAVKLTRDSTTITVYLDVAGTGGNIWLSVNATKFTDKEPATPELLLAFLAAHDQLWPAYLVYYPETKWVELSMSMTAAGFGPATLRTNLDRMMDKFLIVAEAYKKARDAEKAQGGTSGRPSTRSPSASGRIGSTS